VSSLAHRAALHLRYGLQRAALKAIRRDQHYLIEGIQVTLPPEHRLPYFQAVFPSYDRYFLPILNALSATQPVLLVDVGANVGDTAIAAIQAGGDLQVVAVEGNPYFVGYLRHNAAPFADRVQVADRFAGPLNASMRYSHNGSTGSFACADGAAAGTRNGAVGESEGAGDGAPDWVEVSTLVKDPSRLVIWKSDTDGNDIHLAVTNWDTLDKWCGVLWLEYDPNLTQGDPADVAELGRLLGESKRTVWFFDNVGTHMATARGPAAQSLLADLTTWLRRQRAGETAVPYLDLWAFDDACMDALPNPTTLP
jgi:FkbM family methyltransferase